MYITQRKIVSNYCFNPWQNKYYLQNIITFVIIIIFHLQIQRNRCEFFPLQRMAIFFQAENIIMERFTYLIMDGDHILINFVFGCIIDIQINFKKRRREPTSLKADKQLKPFLGSLQQTLLMFVSYVCKKPKMFGPRGL